MNRTRFDPNSMTIQVWTGKAFQVIELSEITTAAELLACLLHANAQAWGSGTALKDLMGAFEDACRHVFGVDAKQVFCARGTSTKVLWPQ